MRRRLYFLLPDVTRARQVVDELLLSRVESRHIHVLAREDIDLEDMPQANLLQRSDLVHGTERGLIIGGATGVAAGLVAISFPPDGIALGGWTMLACALAGALIGAWAAGMIGTDAPNSQLKSFEKAVQEGQVLMMVDVRKSEVEPIKEMVKRHHPEADMRGTEPELPAFP